MGKMLVSTFVVFGILFGIHSFQPSDVQANLASSTNSSPENCVVPQQQQQVAYEGAEQTSSQSQMAKVSLSESGSTIPEGTESESPAVDPEAPFTSLEESEVELIPPVQENIRGSLNPAALEQKKTAPKQMSGELVLDNSVEKEAESAEVEERPGFEALSSEQKGANANIYFAFDSYKLSKSGEATLATLAEQILSNPELKIQIAGNTDSVGDPRVNKAFSSARAHVVQNKLASLGVPRKRMKVVSFEKSRPLDPNVPLKGQSANRRVEVRSVE